MEKSGKISLRLKALHQNPKKTGPLVCTTPMFYKDNSLQKHAELKQRQINDADNLLNLKKLLIADLQNIGYITAL